MTGVSWVRWSVVTKTGTVIKFVPIKTPIVVYYYNSVTMEQLRSFIRTAVLGIGWYYEALSFHTPTKLIRTKRLHCFIVAPQSSYPVLVGSSWRHEPRRPRSQLTSLCSFITAESRPALFTSNYSSFTLHLRSLVATTRDLYFGIPNKFADRYYYLFS